MTVFHFDEASDLNSSFVTFHDRVFAKQPFILIVVAPDWCGHCKAMEPELTKFLQSEKKTNDNIVYFTDRAYNHLVNDHGDNKVAKTLKSLVNGYPSITAVEAKKTDAINVHELDKPRTQAGLKAFKKKHLSQAKEKMKARSRKKA